MTNNDMEHTSNTNKTETAEKKTIAVICGGDSSEHDVSMKSADGIVSFLDSSLYIRWKFTTKSGRRF